MMKHGKVFLVCLLSLVLSVSMAFAQDEPEYKEGELLVKFKPAISSQAATMSPTSLGSQATKRFRKVGIELVKLRPDLTTKEAVELYKQDPNIQHTCTRRIK